jgi:acylphosphatase
VVPEGKPQSAVLRRRIVFSGRVQGVGFRATARDAASGHPVSGWVRNEPDGSVLLEVQGTAVAVESYLEELRSRMGRLISRETVTDVSVSPSEARFEVRHDL